MGLGVTAHAIGDATIRQFIDGVQALKEKYGDLPGRYTLSHSIMLHPDDMDRVTNLDINVEFSPVAWYPSDLAKAQTIYLGEERMQRWFPMNSGGQRGQSHRARLGRPDRLARSAGCPGSGSDQAERRVARASPSRCRRRSTSRPGSKR